MDRKVLGREKKNGSRKKETGWCPQKWNEMKWSLLPPLASWCPWAASPVLLFCKACLCDGIHKHSSDQGTREAADLPMSSVEPSVLAWSWWVKPLPFKRHHHRVTCLCAHFCTSIRNNLLQKHKAIICKNTFSPLSHAVVISEVLKHSAWASN